MSSPATEAVHPLVTSAVDTFELGRRRYEYWTNSPGLAYHLVGAMLVPDTEADPTDPASEGSERERAVVNALRPIGTLAVLGRGVSRDGEQASWHSRLRAKAGARLAKAAGISRIVTSGYRTPSAGPGPSEAGLMADIIHEEGYEGDVAQENTSIATASNIFNLLHNVGPDVPSDGFLGGEGALGIIVDEHPTVEGQRQPAHFDLVVRLCRQLITRDVIVIGVPSGEHPDVYDANSIRLARLLFAGITPRSATWNVRLRVQAMDAIARAKAWIDQKRGNKPYYEDPTMADQLPESADYGVPTVVEQTDTAAGQA
ncbi:MAG TPA: hypothetical protein VLF69_00945 [Candidatus Saccharimonadales bacterium]|nr:hypothetical protein [Candidatus Saccharimonadales bacterium]